MKKAFLLINILIITLMMSATVFADDGWPTNDNYDSSVQFTEDSVKDLDEIRGTIESMDRSTKSFSTYTNNEDVLPDVTIDDAIEWANKKGFEIIHFLQVLVQPFAIIIFIISALFTLVGSIGRGDLSGKGLWGMVISVIVYAIVLYAPVILKAFVSFIAS